jgi:hypothetical protein
MSQSWHLVQQMLRVAKQPDHTLQFHGQNALHIAATHGNYGMIRLLLDTCGYIVNDPVTRTKAAVKHQLVHGNVHFFGRTAFQIVAEVLMDIPHLVDTERHTRQLARFSQSLQVLASHSETAIAATLQNQRFLRIRGLCVGPELNSRAEWALWHAFKRLDPWQEMLIEPLWGLVIRYAVSPEDPDFWALLQAYEDARRLRRGGRGIVALVGEHLDAYCWMPE